MKNPLAVWDRHRRLWTPLVVGVVLIGIIACRPDMAKKGAQDQAIFGRNPLPGAYLTTEAGAANIIRPGRHWRGRVGADAGLTFAGWRGIDGTLRFCLVILCDPEADRLVLFPLGRNETPLTVLSDPARRRDEDRRVAPLRRDFSTAPAPFRPNPDPT